MTTCQAVALALPCSSREQESDVRATRWRGAPGRPEFMTWLNVAVEGRGKPWIPHSARPAAWHVTAVAFDASAAAGQAPIKIGELDRVTLRLIHGIVDHLLKGVGGRFNECLPDPYVMHCWRICRPEEIRGCPMPRRTAATCYQAGISNLRSFYQ